LQWACRRCTLLNDAHVRRCTACGTATSSAGGRFRMAVEMVEPLVRGADEVKRIAQRHWKEKQRLQDVCAASSQEICEASLPFVDIFDEFLELHSGNLLRGIYSYGFEKPNAFQQLSLEPILAGRDVLGILAKGSAGKTTACLIGALGRINYDLQECQAIILTPTRELSRNIEKAALALGDYLKVRCLSVSSGAYGIRDMIDKLRDRQQLVVGTPGRVLDHIWKRHLKLDSLSMVIVDDMDEMLHRGLKDQLFDIFKLLQRDYQDVQRCLFSATLPQEMQDFAAMFLRGEARIHLRPQASTTLNHVRQFYVSIEKEEWKLDTLCDLFETIEVTRSIVYCNTLRKVKWLTEQLQKRELPVAAIYSLLDRHQQGCVLRDFRTGLSDVLICDDTAPLLGIDAQDAGFVVIYDLPQNVESYLHRAGHKGRWRHRSVAINFVTSSDVQTLKDVEKYYDTTIEEIPMDIADLIEDVNPEEIERRHYLESDPREPATGRAGSHAAAGA